MKDLSVYHKNGSNAKYIVFVIDSNSIVNYDVAATKKTADKRNFEYYYDKAEVMTFRQAAKKYPEHFTFEI